MKTFEERVTDFIWFQDHNWLQCTTSPKHYSREVFVQKECNTRSTQVNHCSIGVLQIIQWGSKLSNKNSVKPFLLKDYPHWELKFHFSLYLFSRFNLQSVYRFLQINIELLSSIIAQYPFFACNILFVLRRFISSLKLLGFSLVEYSPIELKTWEVQFIHSFILLISQQYLCRTIVYIHGSDCKDSACNVRDAGLTPCTARSPCRREWLPTPVVLSGESHGQRSLVVYNPWGCKESDTTEQLTLSLFSWCIFYPNIFFDEKPIEMEFTIIPSISGDETEVALSTTSDSPATSPS